ncbi:MAG: hypothetical protein RJB62_693 [Pseudomonadota bacterium]|jgi:secondary thiamine-phosphate synthase enzyme
MLRQASTTRVVTAQGPRLTDITRDASAFVSQSGIKEGLLTLFLRHTSASLVIQENADTDVLRDLEDFFSRLVTRDTRVYRHTTEGADDMPAHIRAALTQTSLSIPVTKGELALGVWQAIYLFEHRDAPHRREVMMHVVGE